MAYYATTGKHPFDGDDALIEKQIREATPSSPIELGGNVLRNITAIILACLEKNPERRPTMEFIARCYADSADLIV